jgi:hypothetical protein
MKVRGKIPLMLEKTFHWEKIPLTKFPFFISIGEDVQYMYSTCTVYDKKYKWSKVYNLIHNKIHELCRSTTLQTDSIPYILHFILTLIYSLTRR